MLWKFYLFLVLLAEFVIGIENLTNTKNNLTFDSVGATNECPQLKPFTTVADSLINYDPLTSLFDYTQWAVDMNSGIPVVGPMFGACFNVIVQKTSPEYKCIQELRTVIEHKFEELKDVIRDLINQLRVEL